MGYADGNIVIGTSVDVGGLNTGLAKISKSFKKLNAISGTLLGIGALVKLGNAAIDAASNLEEVQNVVDQTFGEEYAWKMNRFANIAIESFGMSELAAKQYASSFAAMGHSMGLTADEATSMAIKLTALTGDFASFYNISQDYAKVALSAVYTGETETLKRYGIVLTEANLQEYASTLGIEKKVKAMSAREKLILRYKYILEATNLVEGDFVRTQNSWANQTRVLRQLWTQFLVTLGNGLKIVMIPFIKIMNMALQALIRFTQTLWELVARIFPGFGEAWNKLNEGKGTTDMFEGIADDAEDATDAVEDLTKATKKYLSPLDEISRFTSDPDMGNMFEDALGLDFSDIDWDAMLKGGDDIGSLIPDNVKTIFDLGKWISDTIADSLRKINWDDIYAKARDFGRKLAEFLNGFFTPENFRTFGVSVAGAMNTIIQAILGFAEDPDIWTRVGLSIAEFINGWLEEFNAEDCGKAIDKVVQGIKTLIITTFKGINWTGEDSVAEKLGELFDNISPSTILILIAPKLLKIAGHIVKFFWDGLTREFKAAASRRLRELITTNILSDSGFISTSIQAGRTFATNFISGAATTLSTFFGDAGAFLQLVKEFGLKKTVTDLFPGFAEALLPASLVLATLVADAKEFKHLWETDIEFKTNIEQKFKDIKKTFDETLGKVSEHLDTLKKRFEKLQEAWDKATEPVKIFWNETLSPLIDKFKEFWADNVQPFIDKIAAPEFVKAIGGITKATEGVIEQLGAIIDFSIDTLILSIDAAVGLLSGDWTDFGEDFGVTWDDIKEGLDGFRDTWEGLYDSFHSNGNSLIDFFEKKFGPSMSDAFVNMKDSLKDSINTIIDFLNSLMSSFGDAINAIVDGVNSLKLDPPAWARRAFGVGTLSFHLKNVSVPQLPKLATGAVIPPNKEFMAILGDQKRGTNIETPENLLRQIMREELGGNNGGSYTFVAQLDGRTIFKEVISQAKLRQMSSATNPFELA